MGGVIQAVEFVDNVEPYKSELRQREYFEQRLVDHSRERADKDQLRNTIDEIKGLGLRVDWERFELFMLGIPGKFQVARKTDILKDPSRNEVLISDKVFGPFEQSRGQLWNAEQCKFWASEGRVVNQVLYGRVDAAWIRNLGVFGRGVRQDGWIEMRKCREIVCPTCNGQGRYRGM